jgi:putative NADPH-quinone reductase
MPPKRIFVFCGHPSETSFCGSLAQSYATAAQRAGHSVRLLMLSQLEFDDLHTHYREAPPLEPDLAAFWANLTWCEHWTIVHPLWWGGLPGRLKGLLDRTLRPGEAFAPSSGNGFPKPLLVGRSSRTIITADTPGWFLRWGYGNSIVRQLDRQILKFCGIRPNRFSVLGPIKHSTEASRQRWLAKAASLGATAR